MRRWRTAGKHGGPCILALVSKLGIRVAGILQPAAHSVKHSSELALAGVEEKEEEMEACSSHTGLENAIPPRQLVLRWTLT